MPLTFQGITAWVADSEGRELPEYGVKLFGNNQIECWIPSTEGANFRIMWRIPYFNPLCPAELAVRPFLDGVRMGGTIWSTTNLLLELVGELGTHPTGPSTARLYEFGKRVLTDRDDALMLSNAQLDCLNTIVASFVWGFRGMPQLSEYMNPGEFAPINEKSVKHGHSGSAGLGKAIARHHGPTYSFHSIAGLNPITFIFRYAPRDWLQARDIIPYSPRPSPQPQVKPKRQRSFSSDVIDNDDLHTDDEGIVARKHQIPTSIAPRKKKRTVKREEADVKIEAEYE